MQVATSGKRKTRGDDWILAHLSLQLVHAFPRHTFKNGNEKCVPLLESQSFPMETKFLLNTLFSLLHC